MSDTEKIQKPLWTWLAGIPLGLIVAGYIIGKSVCRTTVITSNRQCSIVIGGSTGAGFQTGPDGTQDQRVGRCTIKSK